MANKNEVTLTNVRISAAERTRNSVNGNPGWRFITDHGVFRLQTDAAIGYAISNYTNSRSADYMIGDDAPPVTLTMTKANRVYGIKLDSGE